MSAFPFSVRPAQAGDAFILRDLYHHLNPNDLALGDEEATTSLAAMLAQPGMTVFIGFAEREPVATATLVVIPNMTRGGAPYALIENVVTSARFRKHGYGRAVIEKAIDTAWAGGCYKVMLMTGTRNTETHQFYQACGFVQDKTGYQIRNGAFILPARK